MTITELKNELVKYQTGDTQRSWKMKNQSIEYDNEYINVVRIDSSNKWIATNEMIKQWSIIIEIKKDFSHLKGFIELSNNSCIKITPVLKGKNEGCYGIRIYNMKLDPDTVIIKKLLDFIFS